MPNIAVNFKVFSAELKRILSTSPIETDKTDEQTFVAELIAKIEQYADEKIEDAQVPFQVLKDIASQAKLVLHAKLAEYAVNTIEPFCTSEWQLRTQLQPELIKFLYNCKIVTDISLAYSMPLSPAGLQLFQQLFATEDVHLFIFTQPFPALIQAIQKSAFFSPTLLHSELTHLQSSLENKWGELAKARELTTPVRLAGFAITPEMQARFVQLSKYGRILGTNSAPNSPTSKTTILSPKANSAPTTPKDLPSTSSTSEPSSSTPIVPLLDLRRKQVRTDAPEPLLTRLTEQLEGLNVTVSPAAGSAPKPV